MSRVAEEEEREGGREETGELWRSLAEQLYEIEGEGGRGWKTAASTTSRWSAAHRSRSSVARHPRDRRRGGGGLERRRSSWEGGRRGEREEGRSQGGEEEEEEAREERSVERGRMI